MIYMSAQSLKFWVAVLYAAIVAGIVSTIVQLLLWWAFWDALPGILYRDARFAAAIIMGQEALPPPETFDWQVMFIATGIHFILSIVYVIMLSQLIDRLKLKSSLIMGGLYGLALFTINMYGFVILLPWFVETRDWITVVAHIIFGVSAAGVYKALSIS
jgi:hypothetical protein